MAIIPTYDYAPFDESDPDDFRPDSRWALLVDPGGTSEKHVDDIHPINEVIVIVEGDPEVTLGDETRTLGPGGIVFIPAGTPHRTRNGTTSPVRIHAMFPSERIGIEYLERNPAPGTEDDPPQPAVTIYARAPKT
jgi:hypothetical protein